MTITVNTVNNLEHMLSDTMKALNAADKKNSGIDKTVDDFKSVIDKTLKHVDKPSEMLPNEAGFEQKINNAEMKIEEIQAKTVEVKEQVVEIKSKTISDLKELSVVQTDLGIDQAIVESIKNLISTEEMPKNWTEFKDVLTQITDEVNAEASLDLTLARDITEIIAQLKEAVENADKIADKNENFSTVLSDTDESIDIAEELLAALENLNNKDENFENDESEQKSNDNEQIEIPFEQILTFTDKVVESNLEAEPLMEKTDRAIKLSDSIEVAQSETIEFTENLADEVVSVKPTSEDVDSRSELAIDEDLLKDLNVESVKVETDTAGNESLMQNQTPQEQGLKAMLNSEPGVFDVKVDNAQNQMNAQASQLKTADVNPSRIIDQITKHLEGLQNNSKVSIVLNPESLGKVNVQLLTTKEGLAAQFTVTTQEAKDLLMKSLDGLKESLASHGVGVDNVSVKVTDSQKSEYKQDWTEQEGSRGGNKGQGQPNREEKEKGLFEKMMAQTEEKENGNV